MTKRIWLFAAILVLVAVPTVTTGVALAYTGDLISSGWASVTPTIDGVIGAGEWDDAWTDTTTILGTTLTAYAKNDATYLYFAGEGDPTPDIARDLMVFFDNGHNQVLDAGDDMKMLSADGLGGLVVQDYYWDGVALDWLQDSSAHVSAAYTYAAGPQRITIEGRVPLASGDGQDMSTAPGETIGMMWYYHDAFVDFAWPESMVPPDPYDPTTWGELQLASAGGGGGCFIATAALGPDDSSVQTLRTFRDTHLATNAVGSGFVSAYYKLSPPIAGFIDEHPALKPVVRAALLPSVGISQSGVGMGLAARATTVASMLLASIAAALWLRRRAVAGKL